MSYPTEDAAFYSWWNSRKIIVDGAVIRITAAQIKTLNASPVVLLQAPGAGLAWHFDHVTYQYKFGTAAFGNVGNADLRIYYEGTPTTYSPINSLGFLDQIIDMVAANTIILPTLASPRGQSICENQRVMLQKNAGPEYSLGDGELYVTMSVSLHRFS